MSFLKKLFSQKDASTIFSNEELIEATVCPNCWGKQEWDGKFTDYVKDQTKSNINHDATHQKAFIQQFVETNVTGIRLKNQSGQLTCTKCKGQF